MLDKGIKVSLGTDVSGGTSLGILSAMSVSRFQHCRLAFLLLMLTGRGLPLTQPCRLGCIQDDHLHRARRDPFYPRLGRRPVDSRRHPALQLRSRAQRHL